MSLTIAAIVVSVFVAPAMRPDRATASLAHVYERLWSKSDDLRESAVREILQERRDILFQCYQVLAESAPREDQLAKEAAKAAAQILGEYRCVEAVPLLTKNLTLSAPPADIRAKLQDAAGRIVTPEEVFPCAGALIQIGLPAVEPVVGRAEATDDELVHRLAAHVLRRVLGPTWAGAYLEDRIAKESDPASRERLVRLKAQLQERLGSGWARPGPGRR